MNFVKAIPMLLMLATVLATAASAQFTAPSSGLREGSLSVSFQNYYNRVNGQTAYNVQGGAVRFRHFFPKRGLLSAQFEPLLSKGSIGFGENYLSLTGVPWKGRHWDLFGGEFRSESLLVENPFSNYQQPQIGLRGGRVIARTGEWTASAFAGQETLAQGSRVSLRKAVPQSAFGAQLSGKVRETIQLGFRLLHLKTSRDTSERTSSFFPSGRRIISSTSGTAQTSIRVKKNLRVYGEASLNRSAMASGSSSNPSSVSWAAGPAYISDRFTLRGNYVRQGYGYLPAAGYYLGDRRGPSVDGSAHFGRVGFSANWLQSSNNVERDTNVPDFFSRQGGGNIYAHLPFGFSASGSFNQIGLRTQSAGEETRHHQHRQYLASLSRRVYRHNLRLSWIRTDLNMHGTSQRVASWEIEDSFAWRGVTATAAVRLQRMAGDESRQTYFTRSALQWGHGSFSIYGNWEQGRDLANESIFSTTVSNTSVVGMSWEAPHGLGVRMETFRTTNNTVLNAQNLFLLNTRGIVPETVLSRSNDWNFYLRVTRELGWGSHVVDGQTGGLVAQAPLVGSISGFVKLRTMAGDLPAANVWVVTDTGISVRTDKTGYYAIPEILHGKRSVKLDEDRLPADYSPIDPTLLLVDVKPDQMSRADLSVQPLVFFEGIVRDQNGTPMPEGVVLSLPQANMQTTTDEDGSFGFYSLPEGDYEIEVVSTELPDLTPIDAAESTRVSVRHATVAPNVEVRINVAYAGPKPIREVNLQAASKPVKVTVAPAKTPKVAPTGKPGKRAAVPAERRVAKPVNAAKAAAGQSGTAAGRRVVISTSGAQAASAKPAPAPASAEAKSKAKGKLMAANLAQHERAALAGERRLLAKSNN